MLRLKIETEENVENVTCRKYTTINNSIRNVDGIWQNRAPPVCMNSVMGYSPMASGKMKNIKNRKMCLAAQLCE